MVGEAAGERAGASGVGHAAQGLNALEAGEEGAIRGTGWGTIVLMFDEIPVTGGKAAGPVGVRVVVDEVREGA